MLRPLILISMINLTMAIDCQLDLVKAPYVNLYGVKQISSTEKGDSNFGDIYEYTVDEDELESKGFDALKPFIGPKFAKRLS